MKVGDKITIRVSRLQRLNDWLRGYKRYPVIYGIDYGFSAEKKKKPTSKTNKERTK